MKFKAVEPPLFKEAMKDILRTTTSTARARLEWSRWAAFASAKNNGNRGTDGCRLIHVLCPVGKAWATSACKACDKEPKVQAYAT